MMKYGNKILYGMCNGEYGKHKDCEIVSDRLLLISRTHAV